MLGMACGAIPALPQSRLTSTGSPRVCPYRGVRTPLVSFLTVIVGRILTVLQSASLRWATEPTYAPLVGSLGRDPRGRGRYPRPLHCRPSDGYGHRRGVGSVPLPPPLL